MFGLTRVGNARSMPPADPLARLDSATDLGDLRRLVERPGTYATLAIPSPSGVADADHRLEVRWQNARRELLQQWETAPTEVLDRRMAELPHDAADAIIVVVRDDGTMLTEQLLNGIAGPEVVVAPLPRLAAVIESRQRTIPHLVVVTDRAGADIVGFDGGSVIDETVSGDTLHIHRGHPGGWSQRRYQQRAENTWKRNADETADAIGTMATELDPDLIAIAGDVRARQLVADALPDTIADRVEIVVAGDTDGLSDAVVTLLADKHARTQVAAFDQLAEAAAHGMAASGESALDALESGRVETLLAHDDGGDGPTTLVDGQQVRLVDRAIQLALDTNSRIMIVPKAERLEGPIAATLRW